MRWHVVTCLTLLSTDRREGLGHRQRLVARVRTGRMCCSMVSGCMNAYCPTSSKKAAAHSVLRMSMTPQLMPAGTRQSWLADGWLAFSGVTAPHAKVCVHTCSDEA